MASLKGAATKSEKSVKGAKGYEVDGTPVDRVKGNMVDGAKGTPVDGDKGTLVDGIMGAPVDRAKGTSRNGVMGAPMDGAGFDATGGSWMVREEAILGMTIIWPAVSGTSEATYKLVKAINFFKHYF